VQAGIVEPGQDQQHAVGAEHARLVHLVRIDHEVLAQHRQRAGRARLLKVNIGALEIVHVGQHREAGRTAGFVAARDRGRVEVGADHALRGAGLLHLGDHRGVPGGDLRFDGVGEAAHRRRIGQARGQLRARHACAALGHLLHLAREDAGQHVVRWQAAHATPSPPARAGSAAASARVAATNPSSFARAAPEAMVARASSTPPAIESATPATYSAAPALSDTIRPGRPSASVMASSTMAFEASAPSTTRLRLAAIGMPKSSGWISYSRTWPSRSSPTRVPAPSEISSMPSRPQTTSARSAPSSCSTRTWMPTRSGWNTPIRIAGAPAGLVSGPRMLNSVRTPISRRTGATTFIAGWEAGAYMKPMPVRAMDSATASGASSIAAPSASYASALPEVEDTLRPPCLATRPPAAAITKLDAVEMLKVWAPSPPVPTMSTRCVRSATSTLRASSRIARAAPVISPTVSFFTRSPTMIAAVICGETS